MPGGNFLKRMPTWRDLQVSTCELKLLEEKEGQIAAKRAAGCAADGAGCGLAAVHCGAD